MLTEDQKQMVLAAICIAALVFVAFFAGYHGQNDSSYQFSQVVQNKQPPRYNARQQSESHEDITTEGSSSTSTSIRITCDPTCRAQTNNHSDDYSFYMAIRKFFEDPIEFITLVLALANVVLAYLFTVQITDGRKASERQLRAYVHIAQAVRTVPHQPGPEFAVEIKNFGQTPARQGTYWFKTKIDDTSSEAGFNKPHDVEIGRFELAPSGTVTFSGINSEPDKLTLTREQFVSFQEGKFAFFVFGEINYTDAFDERRTTKFRVKYAQDGMVSGRLSNCKDGNEST